MFLLRPHRSGCVSTYSRRLLSSVNHFNVIGVDPSFAIDLDELKVKYRAKMVELHPDKHTSKPLSEQQIVLEKASAVTAAYNNLSQVHPRALHLLELWAGTSEEDLPILDSSFLMEVMELREQIDTSRPEDLKKMETENKERESETLRQLSKAFLEKDLAEAANLTAKLQYWIRIHEAIEARR